MAWEPSIIWRKKKWKPPVEIPLAEWQKRFAMLPEEVVKKTLENSTNFYSNVEAEKHQDPRQYFKWQFPISRYNRQREPVASDIFFPQ
eukprot:15294270-Ditylum_brightwellii.AAC.2